MDNQKKKRFAVLLHGRKYPIIKREGKWIYTDDAVFRNGTVEIVEIKDKKAD